MPLKLMIDSGAFSVWNVGKTIDLDGYIKFCKDRPNLSVIVALDVIPPKKAKLTDELKAKVAAEGWSNYLKMIRQLPMEKVVPVFHRGDSFKWLEKMLDFGCPYIGLSPRHDGTGSARRDRFLNESKKYLLDSSGKAITKVHGFAVTNHRMMLDFEWYSVDSASWVLVSAWGGILVPQRTNGQWDFFKQPFRVFCSVLGMKRQDANHHLLAMKEQRPEVYSTVMQWLSENGIGLGTHNEIESLGRKPVKITEKWANKEKTRILQIRERGVTNCHQVRYWINAVYFHKVNDSLGMKNLYLAGGSGVSHSIEEQVRYRLGTFVDKSYQNKLDDVYPLIGSNQPPVQFPLSLRDS